MTQPAQARKGKSRDAPRTYAWPPLPPHEFEVISVTSAIGRAMAKPHLIGWAAKVTAEKAIDDHAIIGAMLEKGDERGAIAHVKGARYADSGTKADRGTIVHGALEAYIAGKPIGKKAIEEQLKEMRVPIHMWKSAAAMINGVMEFLYDEEPQIYWSESTVYSRKHGYAGTPDVLAKMRVGGTLKPVVIDIKTSKSIYDEVALQLSAYANADFVGLDDGTEKKLLPGKNQAIEHGVVVRPTASGKYEKAVFTLTPDIHELFLAMLHVAKNQSILETARRPS